MDVEYPVEDLEDETMEEDEEQETGEVGAKGHKDALERMKEKDPEFYKFLQEHDKDLLAFDEEEDDGVDDDEVDDADADTDVDEPVSDHVQVEKEDNSSKTVVTTSMVETWIKAAVEDGKIGALRSLLKAFRIACHYGDDSGDDSAAKLSTMSSSVFNKIMVFVLTEMDGILRKMLGLPAYGGKKEMMIDVMGTRKWKNYSHLVKSYLGNALHVLNQMTDPQMVSFTLRRLQYSSLLLAAFPSLLRKYVKVALHFWGTGGGALPVISTLFLRDLCIRLGSECADECFKGMYKAYVLNCQFINAVKMQHIQFLGNCVIELFRVDLQTAYQQAFVYIRQLAMILRDAITVKTKESFRRVYEWKFMNCLELWTSAICAYSSEADFMPLAYPLTQIISGVASLVPTARYFPLRLRCVRMLNRIAASTRTFIPVSTLLLDMLEMKELNRPPTGGVGKAVDLRTMLKVNKPTLKTRGFQEACVYSVVEELAEHLSQWSYSMAFFELSFIPAVRLRTFCKVTKVDRFRKEMRRLVRQVEANCKFTNEKRSSITLLPNDLAAASEIENENKMGPSPLSQYVVTLRQRAEQRNSSMMESSVIVGENSSILRKKISKEDDEDDDYEDDSGNEEAADVFNSSWLPRANPSEEKAEKNEKKKKKRKKGRQEDADGDIVEDLVLSSDEDEPLTRISDDEGENANARPQKKKQKLSKEQPRSKKDQPHSKKPWRKQRKG
ncbi:Nucleolar complex-associated protein 2 [Linum perenne]